MIIRTNYIHLYHKYLPVRKKNSTFEARKSPRLFTHLYRQTI